MTEATVYAMHRVEPICREGDPGRGLAAPVHDPLWLLARQWEFGEFDGEDAGTPIQVDATVAQAAIDGWSTAATGDQPAQSFDFDPAAQVLEAAVAGESAGPAHSSRDRLDAGRRLTALLPAAAADLTAALPVTAPADDRLLQRLAARFPDGLSAAQKITAGGSDALLASALGIADALVAANRPALETFARWATDTFGLTPNTWYPERLERQFGLRVAGATALQARAHTRDTVDAIDLDLTSESSSLLEPAQDVGTTVHRVPTPVRFPGMPNDRFWAFEDAQIALHRIDAATHDLARMALVEFSTIYGNDWFAFPVGVQYGSVVTCRELTVRDTFTTLADGTLNSAMLQTIHEADDVAFSLYRPTRPAGVSGRLVVPPVAVGVLTGPFTEEVAFVRDENANLVWALEKLITDGDGVLRNRVAEYAARVTPAPELPVDADLLYELMTQVPDYWVPFIPVHLDAVKRQVGLIEALLPRPSADGAAVVVSQPLSSVLQELQNTAIREEEIPSEGVTVRRRWYLARSVDGGRHAWAARSAAVGRGEGSSGLAFDITKDVRSS